MHMSLQPPLLLLHSSISKFIAQGIIKANHNIQVSWPTIAGEPIFSKIVSYVTGTFKAVDHICANVFTSTIVDITLIYICGNKKIYARKLLTIDSSTSAEPLQCAWNTTYITHPGLHAHCTFTEDGHVLRMATTVNADRSECVALQQHRISFRAVDFIQKDRSRANTKKNCKYCST